MVLSQNERIFDTLIDTANFYVSVNHYFTIRKFGKECAVYLFISGNKQRERISTEIKAPTLLWDEKKARFKEVNQKMIDYNLILGQLEGKIEGIKVNYRLTERILTPAILKKELKSGLTRISFLAYFKESLKSERSFLEPGSYKRHNSVYAKLCKYKEDIAFQDIDLQFFKDFKIWCVKRGNAHTTIASNIASLKKFLKLAKKDGIKLKFDLEDVIAGSSRGNRTPLKLHDLKRLIKYYKSEFISESEKLTLGYFLFACLSGLRVSDVGKLQRKDMYDNYITFVSKKGKKDQLVTLINQAEDIVNYEPKLFQKRVAEQTMNKLLKKIALQLGIKIKVTFHTSRHTFATLYLISGGTVQNLMLLLGHKKIETTMIYAHIVAVDANNDMFRLDDLFKEESGHE